MLSQHVAFALSTRGPSMYSLVEVLIFLWVSGFLIWSIPDPTGRADVGGRVSATTS
jgi:hypothetical protein